ncbi:FtsH protease activity modulator HflK [Orrella sp. NBD-18]|uniref:Protein HflK n=1 Tax=Sheuella amnicola TaxID=2707330 RepID=A0A6B2R0L4_9BURK|nr:FtsH protease activity modulator HflK [Sheuella amnicola]NDY83558.1 FtsH protease activity modulator HflK [Sheuella amnicola]HBI82593.1 FtsH protease activity modulator HflK [Alcaligenaceae bacterium]
MRFLTKIFNLNDPGWGRGQGSNGSEPPSGGQQPPKRPPQQSGPPDLDQVWRDFNQRLGSLFGRKQGGHGSGDQGPGGLGGPTARQSRIGLGVIVLIAAAIWLGSGFFIVQDGQVAVVTQFGKYKNTVQAGFQWRLPYPIESQEIVNVSQLRTLDVGFRGNARSRVLPEALMLTEDENIVDVQFVVQYRLRANGAPDYLFKLKDPDESVRQAAQSSMREVVGTRKMDSVLYESRTDVANTVQKLMQQILDSYQSGIQISSVAIQNVQPPEQVQAAFDDAVKAGQDSERQSNEGRAYLNQIVPMARGQASRIIEQAEGYRAKVVGNAVGDTARFSSVLAEYRKSPQVIRERMYLETMQQMYSGANKVLVDTRGSGNMLYLPLDKIMQQVAQDPAKAAPVTGASVPAPVSTPVAPVTSSSTSRANQSAGQLTRDRANR